MSGPGATPGPVSRLLIEYVGTPFAGWARQPGRRTVQDEVERGLATLLRRDVHLTVAGRTDRGVHAWGQVASHAGEPAPVTGLNAVLPREIRVLQSARAADGFDARRDAVSRSYCYRVLARRAPSPFEHDRALWWPHRIERAALDACAAALVGTRDFTAFTPSQTEHVHFHRRVIRADWSERGDLLEFWIEADAFLRHMNRVLVATMLEVAGGRRRLEDFEALLEGRPREQAAATAPPHGLYLASVAYPGAEPGPGLPSQGQ